MTGCFSPLASFKKSLSGYDSEEDDVVPDELGSSSTLLISDSMKRDSESLTRRLSTFQAPLVIQGQPEEAYVNVSPYTPSKPNSPTAMFQRLKSLAPLNLNGAFSTELTPRESTKFDWSTSRKVLETAIAIEQQNTPFDNNAYGESIALQEQRLALRLNKLRLDHYISVGDGNCQFRSVSFGLYGTQDHHNKIRRKAVEYMNRNRQEFEMFLGEDFQRYAHDMSHNGVWGDELTLRAICETYSIVINVLTTEAENWFLRYIPANGEFKHEIFLSYISPVHYNAVKRRKAIEGLLRSFSSGTQRQGSLIMKSLDEYEKGQQVALPSNPQQLLA